MILKFLGSSTTGADEPSMKSRSGFFMVFGLVFSLVGLGTAVGGLVLMKTGDFGAGLILFLLFGGSFGGIGFFTLRRALRARATLRRLQASGVPVEGRVLKVALDTSVSVNDENPWVLKCEWHHPKTGESVKGDSDYFWEDPSDLYSEGSAVTVLVDLEDPTLYWIDAGGEKSALRAA